MDEREDVDGFCVLAVVLFRFVWSVNMLLGCIVRRVIMRREEGGREGLRNGVRED